MEKKVVGGKKLSEGLWGWHEQEQRCSPEGIYRTFLPQYTLLTLFHSAMSFRKLSFLCLFHSVHNDFLSPLQLPYLYHMLMQLPKAKLNPITQLQRRNCLIAQCSVAPISLRSPSPIKTSKYSPFPLSRLCDPCTLWWRATDQLIWCRDKARAFWRVNMKDLLSSVLNKPDWDGLFFWTNITSAGLVYTGDKK